MNSMNPTIYVSRVKALAINRRRYLARLAIFVLISGVVLIFSGFLHYVSTSLPRELTMFFLGSWLSAGFYIGLA